MATVVVVAGALPRACRPAVTGPQLRLAHFRGLVAAVAEGRYGTLERC